MRPPDRDSVWVHIATSQEVVEVGLRTMLQATDGAFDIVLSGKREDEPDVVLFDVIMMREGDTGDLDQWLKDTATTVIAVDRTLRPELGQQARAHGVEWGITLGISGRELVEVIEQAITGHLDDNRTVDVWNPDYPGESAGLSPRESEVITLVVQGRGNLEIAQDLFVSINSIKTYIRSAYRKIGVSSRAQAVAWGMEHGFQTIPEGGPVSEAE